MTWRGVPRGRAGTIRLSDQRMRDLRASVDAVGRFAAGFGATFSRAFADALLDLANRGPDA